MKITNPNIDRFFDFLGTFGIPSKCGLKIIDTPNTTTVIVTELYQDNPGSSVTSVSSSLAMQICAKFEIPFQQLVYIECAPNMNSKLSFYDEEYFQVDFDWTDNQLTHPRYKILCDEDKVRWIS